MTTKRMLATVRVSRWTRIQVVARTCCLCLKKRNNSTRTACETRHRSTTKPIACCICSVIRLALVVRGVVPHTTQLEQLVLHDIVPRVFEPNVPKAVLTHDGDKLVSPEDDDCALPNDVAISKTMFYVADIEGPTRRTDTAAGDSYVYDAFMTAAARQFEKCERKQEQPSGSGCSLSWLLQGGYLLYDDPTERVAGVYRHTAFVSLPGAGAGLMDPNARASRATSASPPQFATPGHCEAYEISATNVLLGFVVDTFRTQATPKGGPARNFRLMSREECAQHGLFGTILAPVQTSANLALMTRSWNASQLVSTAKSQTTPSAFDRFGERLSVRVLRRMIHDGVRFERHVQRPGDLVIQNGWHLYIKPAGAVALARNTVTLRDLQRIVLAPITADRLTQKHDWWANMYDAVRGETPMVEYIYRILAKARLDHVPVDSELIALVHQLEAEAEVVDCTCTRIRTRDDAHR